MQSVVKRVSLFTGLDYWTGLLDSKFNHKISFHCSHNYQNLSSKAVSLPGSWSNLSLGHLDINFVYSAIRCNREVACVTFSVVKHWRGGLIIQVNVRLHRMIVYVEGHCEC